MKLFAGLSSTDYQDILRAIGAFLDANGVDTSLSMQTGSKTARNLEGSVQNDIGGARYAEQAKQSTRTQKRGLGSLLTWCSASPVSCVSGTVFRWFSNFWPDRRGESASC